MGVPNQRTIQSRKASVLGVAANVNARRRLDMQMALAYPAGTSPSPPESLDQEESPHSLWGAYDWRGSVTKPAWANSRRNYSKELFSVYDSVILLCGITGLAQAKAAEKLLAALLTA